MPSVTGAGCRCTHESGSDPEYRWYHGRMFALFCTGKTERTFCFAKYQIRSTDMKELPKVYDPRDVESRIYKLWMDGDCFKAEPNPDKKPFSIVMPPPNVTGQLHMGHALDCTLQDILTRFKRMQGYDALWLPGTRPRRHRHPDQGGGGAAQQGGPDPLRPGPREVPGARLGSGRRSTAAASSSSRRRWAPPATGAATASPWTRAAPRPCARPSASCMKRA